MFDKLWSNWFNDIDTYFDENDLDLEEIIIDPTKDNLEKLTQATNIDVSRIGTYEFCLYKMFINKLVQKSVYKSPISEPAKLLTIEAFSSHANIKKFLDKDSYNDDELSEIKQFININKPISILALLNDIRIGKEYGEIDDLEYLPIFEIKGIFDFDLFTDTEIELIKNFNDVFSFIDKNFATIKLPNNYDQFLKLSISMLKENYILGIKFPDDDSLRALSTPIVGENKTLGDLAIDIKTNYIAIGAEARKKMRDNLNNYLKQFLY